MIELFKKGVSGSAFYRIPSLVRTKLGTLICACDERIFSSADNPNKIHKIVRRSTDCGVSWEAPRYVVREQGDAQLTSSAAIDPAMLVNEANGEILMLYSHTPAGIGLYNSVRSLGGVRDGKEIPTSYLMLVKSTDDGKTWSEPVCLNGMVKDPTWGFIGAGPGCGICVREGTYAGRLIFPIYYGGNTVQPSLMACVIYSDDGGLTWRRGGDVVSWGAGEIDDGVMLRDDMQLTECQVVEHGNGDLHIYVRNHAACKRIARAVSRDGGQTWGSYEYLTDMPQPICQLSAIRFTRSGTRCVAVINPASETDRVCGTLRFSEDDGQTFPYAVRLTEGTFLYNSSVYIPETDEIGIAYESSWDTICFTKIKVGTINGGRQNHNGLH